MEGVSDKRRPKSEKCQARMLSTHIGARLLAHAGFALIGSRVGSAQQTPLETPNRLKAPQVPDAQAKLEVPTKGMPTNSGETRLHAINQKGVAKFCLFVVFWGRGG